jgi:hypothetical protein
LADDDVVVDAVVGFDGLALLVSLQLNVKFFPILVPYSWYVWWHTAGQNNLRQYEKKRNRSVIGRVLDHLP